VLFTSARLVSAPARGYNSGSFFFTRD
jgi:hypothetical protein